MVTSLSTGLDNDRGELRENLNKTYQAIGLIEQFIDCADTLRGIVKSARDLDSLKREIGLIQLELDALIATLDENNVPIELIRSERVNATKSKIEVLGIGPTIIRQRGDLNMSIKDIAISHNVSESLIRKFLNYYDRCKPSQQSKIKRNQTVFDTVNRLEELNLLIQGQLSRLDSDPAVQVTFIREYRGLLSDAAKITDKQMQLVQYQNFVTAVANVIDEIEPSKRSLVQSSIRSLVNDYQTTTSALTN